MAYVVILISLFLELALSNVLPNILTPLLLLTSITFVYPLFKKNNTNYFIVCIISGLLYDIIINSTFINTITFGICSGIVIFIYNYLKYNILNSSIINIIVIIFYRTISYLLLFILDYTNFNIFVLTEGIYNSLIINVIYGILLYFIINLFINSHKKN